MKKFGLMLVALLVLTAASVAVPGTVYATEPADEQPPKEKPAKEEPRKEKPVWKPGDPIPTLDSPKADHNAYVADLAEITKGLRDRMTAAMKKIKAAIKVLTGLEGRPSPAVKTWKDGEEPTREQVKVYNKQARKYQEWYDALSPGGKALVDKTAADIKKATDELNAAGEELFGKFDKNGEADGNGKYKESDDAVDLRMKNCTKHG